MRARWRRECNAEEEARRAMLFAPVTRGILSERQVGGSVGWAGGMRITDWGLPVTYNGARVGTRALPLRGIE